ncbi:hypothetical protein VaNZ11_012463 [Volvox africanus]|uniref:Uncharacterized protein n=1 Tax=Volvox africanus TaxID=51714 RepID=A0ABQ5SF93_9CHLO|nr:hypothetical protein VaNZ11_012463 [Volvox africanus]
MPQILSLVGKALGNILRSSGSNDSAGRYRNSVDSDGGFDGPKRCRGSAAGASPASEPCSRQRISYQNECLENLGASASQSADLFNAPEKDVGPGLATVGSSGCGLISAGRSSSTGDAGNAAVASATGTGCVCSDAGFPGSNSPPAATHFFRASRASLSDTTSSAAGEALRQASVTTCKHFSRENYNIYVRWVRASRGAMKIAGKLRSREAVCRNPSPTLLLRCEHWLEVTDEQHRYGSNLRVYFDFWVAEMEAAELTPPQSPALISPSPSYSQLVALAQQQQQLQQQQIANAITKAAAAAERISPSQSAHQYNNPRGQRAASAAQVEFHATTPHQSPVGPTLHQQQPVGQPEPQQHAAVASTGQCIGANQGMVPGPGPSRFSSDANAVPRGNSASERRSCDQLPRRVEEQALMPLQSFGSEVRVQHLSHRYPHHQHHYHQDHQQQQNTSALARDRCGTGADGAEGPGDGDRVLTGCSVLSCKSSHLWDEAERQQLKQQVGEGQQLQEGPRAHPHYHPHHHQHHYRRSHHHDLELYEREGSVHHGTDDGGADSLPVSLTVTRSHDGDDDARGCIEPLSPTDAADVTSTGGDDGGELVCCMASSCDPTPTLLQRRQQLQQQLRLQQQRRHSCGESDAQAARHSTAGQPRPSSDAIAIIPTQSVASTVAGPPTSPYLATGSPRRNVLCSPSRRFVLAAMIDMSLAEGQAPETPAPESGRHGLQQAQQAQGAGEPVTEGQIRQQQQQPQQEEDLGTATAAETRVSCGTEGGSGTPATPQQQQQPEGASLLPVTPALTSCGGSASVGGAAMGASGGCTAQRAAKLMSNRASVGTGTSFFRWLDYGPGSDVDLAHLGVSRAKLDTERVKYLTPNELLEYELDVDMETGLLRYKRSGKLLHTGPDGRGSLDEHRRPPTPPPPAVPLALLGEGAAAWWRSSSTSAIVEMPPMPQVAGIATIPPLPRKPAAVARQAFRRMIAMGTVLEGGSGDGCSGSSSYASGFEASRQPLLSGDDAIEAAAAAAVLAEADAHDKAQGFSISTPVAKAGFLPDLELRGHSASSLARLEPSGTECYSEKGNFEEAGAGGSSSSTGDSCGNSRPCSSAGVGRAAANAAAAAVMALSISAGGTGDGAGPGCRASLAAEAQKDDVETTNGITFAKSGDVSSAMVLGPLNGRMEQQPQVLHLPGVMTPPRPAMLARGDVVSTSAVAAVAGAFGSPNAVDCAAAGSMPKTPVATQAPGCGVMVGGGYHHDEKVAKWIYVVDPALRLFVHPKVRGRFHHSSFLRGGAVVAAGGLAARHGRLRLLTADSGHYWPREENFRWLCEHLVYVGADLSVCELRSKHMPVPAATGKELMQKMGVPPPWRLPFQTALSPSGHLSLEPASEAEAPPSPLTEHVRLQQLHATVADGETELGGAPLLSGY